jgi:hypothetical protein
MNIRQLDAQISLAVAVDNKLSAAEVQNRLYSSDERLVVAKAARMYWGELRKIRFSPEWEKTDADEKAIVTTWLRAFNFSDGANGVGYTLASNADFTTVETFRCFECGDFQIEVALDDLEDPTCPECGGEMDFVPVVPKEWATPTDPAALDLPYAAGSRITRINRDGEITTVELSGIDANDEFYQAQRSGYDRDDYGQGELNDDHNTRDMAENWAEYLEPVGLGEFYASTDWQALRQAYQEVFSMADELVRYWAPNAPDSLVWHSGSDEYDYTCLNPQQRWAFIVEHIRPYLEDAWETAIYLYTKDQALNAVGLAMIVHRFVSATRFSREEMVTMTKAVPWLSHVDWTPQGRSFFEFMVHYQDELDELIEDGGTEIVTPSGAEEQRTVDTWAAKFEAELEEHWKYQAMLRKPVEVENGVKIWAGTWTGIGDVAYNLAYLQAVSVLNKAEAEAAATYAKTHARWAANDAWVVGANDAGLVMSNKTTVPWLKAANGARLPVPHGQKEGVLKSMRSLWVTQIANRPAIEAVGLKVKAA